MCVNRMQSTIEAVDLFCTIARKSLNSTAQHSHQNVAAKPTA